MHPIEIINPFLQQHSQILSTELAVYSYEPRQLKNDRKVVRVKKKQLSETFSKLQCKLKPNEDIAFQSAIHFSKTREIRYIPTLDFVTKSPYRVIRFVRPLMHTFSLDTGYIINSGHSFHFYGLGLLSKDEIVKFFGNAIYRDTDYKAWIIDQRWVAYQLYHGYFGALRWTNNAKKYTKQPYVMGKIE